MNSIPPGPWPADAALVRPPLELLVSRYLMLVSLAAFSGGALWFYSKLAERPVQAVEMLPLPLLSLTFSSFCLNEYVAAKPTDTWTLLKVTRRTAISLFASILLVVALRQIPSTWLVPKLPWMLGALHLALAGLLGLGAWWWGRVRFEYTSAELMWAEGFWKLQRWKWTEFTQRDSAGKGQTAVVRLYSRDGQAVCVPLMWPGAERMLLHIHAREL